MVLGTVLKAYVEGDMKGLSLLAGDDSYRWYGCRMALPSCGVLTIAG